MVEFCTYIETLGFPISIDIIIPYTGVDLSVFSWIGKTRITLFVALPYKNWKRIRENQHIYSQHTFIGLVLITKNDHRFWLSF